MRFLVLGASGMAGHVIALHLKERGHDVVGFSRRRVGFVESVAGDAMDAALLERVVREGGFDVVVNAVGVLNRDAEEHRDRAAYLNAYLPHRLAALTADLPTRVVHMSTDCVFRGNTGPYTESSFPDGETFYDRSKALGELVDAKNLTLRNSIVGPDVNEEGIGLFNWFMRQEGPVKGFTGAIWTGLTTVELARAIEAAALEGATGLVNLVPDESISKFELLRLFNERLRGGRVEIVPSGGLSLDKTLVRTSDALSFRAAPYEEQVSEMAAWIRSHADLYPHYGLDR